MGCWRARSERRCPRQTRCRAARRPRGSGLSEHRCWRPGRDPPGTGLPPQDCPAERTKSCGWGERAPRTSTCRGLTVWESGFAERALWVLVDTESTTSQRCAPLAKQAGGALVCRRTVARRPREVTLTPVGVADADRSYRFMSQNHCTAV